jgi:phytol kinase
MRSLVQIQSPRPRLVYNHSMRIAATILVVFLLLLIGELWWRKQKLNTEFTRKFVHITVGTFVAFWPFFLSWQEIRLLSVAFLVAVGISKYLKVFRAIHTVQRPTWGELFFALAVGLITFITQDKWIYATALLQMSLADGFAAVIGTRFGQRFRYIVFGHAKSILGTFTFLVVSAAILVGFSHFGGQELTLIFIMDLAVVASLIENIGVAGLDNLLVPLVVSGALRFLT